MPYRVERNPELCKKILAVRDVAGIYVMTGTKKYAEDVFHVLTIVLMGFTKSFRAIHIH